MKLGVVRYLNARPFVYGLRHLDRSLQMIEDTPSRLEELLDSGEVECALLPAFVGLSRPDLALLPGTGIISFGEARSVRIFSKLPLESAQTIALDTSSRSSAALTRVILAEKGLRPAFVSCEPELDEMLARADAALLIGDLGLSEERKGMVVSDLGLLWQEMTGLPFVFALWAGKRVQGLGCRVQEEGRKIRALAELLLEAKQLGCAHLEEIAAAEAPRLGLSAETCLSYLRDNMQYDLDGPALVGLRRFQKLCMKHGLLTCENPQLADLAAF